MVVWLMSLSLLAPTAAPRVPPPALPARPAPPAADPRPVLREVFPLVRVDVQAGVVEFDAQVAMDCHDPQTPRVYLELVACAPDSREHESLIVTRARPSHVHAALLMLGLEPGAPGRFEPRDGRAVAVPAAGPALEIELAWREGDAPRRAGPGDWIVSAKTGRRFGDAGAGQGDEDTRPVWLFCGSRFVLRPDPAGGERREVYDADGTGVVIGLHTFGSEVIGLGRTLSPDAATLEPEWIADAARVPALGTPVAVRLRAKGADGPAPAGRATRPAPAAPGHPPPVSPPPAPPPKRP